MGKQIVCRMTDPRRTVCWQNLKVIIRLAGNMSRLAMLPASELSLDANRQQNLLGAIHIGLRIRIRFVAFISVAVQL